MDSVNTDERVESFLSVMLEGYEGSLVNLNTFIDQTRQQLEGAVSQKGEVVSKIKELKELLGLEEEEEVETPKLKLVED
jgi:hypothetical protein